MSEKITFQSDGLKLAGIVETPAEMKSGERRPAFIVLHGFGGNKDGQGQTVVAKQFTDWGYVTLRIDFRGCGESEGEHGRIDGSTAPATCADHCATGRVACWPSSWRPPRRRPSGGAGTPAAAAARRRAPPPSGRAAREVDAREVRVRRQGWQWERWRAIRRWSRRPAARPPAAVDDAAHAHAALAADDLLVLLGEPPARAEQRALDGRAAHARAARRSRDRTGPRTRA